MGCLSEYTGVWNYPNTVLGDSVNPVKLLLKDKESGVVIIPDKAVFTLTDAKGKVIVNTQLNVDYNSGEVVIDGLSGDDTNKMGGGLFKYFVKYYLPEDIERTYLTGSLRVTQ